MKYEDAFRSVQEMLAGVGATSRSAYPESARGSLRDEAPKTKAPHATDLTFEVEILEPRGEEETTFSTDEDEAPGRGSLPDCGFGDDVVKLIPGFRFIGDLSEAPELDEVLLALNVSYDNETPTAAKLSTGTYLTTRRGLEWDLIDTKKGILYRGWNGGGKISVEVVRLSDHVQIGVILDQYVYVKE